MHPGEIEDGLRCRMRAACKGRNENSGGEESFSRWPMRTSRGKQVHLQGGDFLAGECFFEEEFFLLAGGCFLFVEKCVFLLWGVFFGGDVALAGKCAGMHRTREEEH